MYLNNVCIHYSFLAENDDENGWIVKMPYTTNSQFVKAASDYSKVVCMIKLAATKYADQVTYAFVQPMMCNKKEYRVVVLGGRAQ